MNRVLLLSVVFLASCSNGSEQLEKRMGEIKHELTSLKATNLALQDRMEALEERALSAGSGEQAEASDAPSDRPALEIVRVDAAPDPSLDGARESASSVAPAPGDDEPPPMIRRNARGEIEVVGDEEHRKSGALPLQRLR